MREYDNLYCKIYVDSDLDIEQLKQKIISIVSGEKQLFRTIVTTFGEIDINKNEDFDDEKRKLEVDGFIYSRYYLDIEPKEDIGQQEYISHIGNLLRSLWSSGLKSVAACDFEEELPQKGGYSR
ncbi:hypothetical protein M972_112761 [Acetivibrio thermocellus AD2]|jgi:hypothetical protein|uniref:1,4-dihydroxy-6-naphthoate synthase n=1 Tax=Acetivibrio thermocellus AD2 TaxID=1138384 RepID=A0AB36TJ55_ACETH|nr:hypothetical protein [Acetivibrio thermocellus]ADU75661.1 hypothetical protein Clo1313_2665 [Acetivibrio thermocellus DSM 1313]ALX09659.1 hypothetical protein AD2_02679 [Acetivibrio thermocellus AD2]ANV77432.1 hypothetical protein LQRI_2691 [Acetivibrio thermocellus DSM 2360]EIC03327.1 hypothetical protein YSBL_2993 [Acetivibrio thermocellus YS]PFH03942.1 hypothetical protein M972_112761 [Acetivibrio thermocellus AD2]